MTVQLVLNQISPIEVQFRVSPLVEMVLATRFAQRTRAKTSPWFLPDEQNLAPVLHSTSFERRDTRRRNSATTLVYRQRPHTPFLGRLSTTPVVRPASETDGEASSESEPLSARSSRPGCDDPWPLLRKILAADLRYRMARIANHGLAAAFDDLFPLVELRHGVLTVRTACHVDPISCHAGLLIMPAVHSDRVVVVAASAEEPPLLIYPAHGAGVARHLTALAYQSSRGVVDLQGACLLRELALPRDVGELAVRHDMDVRSVRQRISAWASEGVVVTKAGAPDTFQRTTLASLLIGPWCQHCA